MRQIQLKRLAALETYGAKVEHVLQKQGWLKMHNVELCLGAGRVHCKMALWKSQISITLYIAYIVCLSP